jgi:hypothetical protein
LRTEASGGRDRCQCLRAQRSKAPSTISVFDEGLMQLVSKKEAKRPCFVRPGVLSRPRASLPGRRRGGIREPATVRTRAARLRRERRAPAPTRAARGAGLREGSFFFWRRASKDFPYEERSVHACIPRAVQELALPDDLWLSTRSGCAARKSPRRIRASFASVHFPSDVTSSAAELLLESTAGPFTASRL